MAIAVERKSKAINWFALAIGLFALFFVGGTVYFLFISKPPGIERFIPSSDENQILQGVQKIESTVDVQKVIDSLEMLETPIPLPGPGILGRPNPFIPI